jgi:ATP/maltotriose-dependent transcriptional regulator MalT
MLQRSLGQIDAAVPNLRAAIERTRELGMVETLRSALSTLATVHLDRLELDAAESLIAEGEQAAPTWDSIDLEDVFDERRYRLHQLRGELAAAWAVTERSLERNRGHSHLHCHLGTQMQAIRLALDSGDPARARQHLEQAQALHDEAGADSLHGAELAVCEVLVRQSCGDNAAALQQARTWLAAPQVRPSEDRARTLIAGALAALAEGEPALARTWLVEAASLPALPQAVHAHRLAAAVQLARSTGQGLAEIKRQAQRWLAQPVVPVFEAALLRAALALA